MECPNCKKQLADNAKSCPDCGYDFTAKSQKLKVNSVLSAVGVIVLIGLFYTGFNFITSPDSPVVQDQLQSINNSVANDAVAQYNIAKQQGDQMQICVQAGIVSAAFLQSKDQVNYNKWKEIEATECKAAGMP